MPNPSENEWAILDSASTATQSHTMATNNDTTMAQPKVELPKPSSSADVTFDAEKETQACTCSASIPILEREDSTTSLISFDSDEEEVDKDYRRRRPTRRYSRECSPSRAGRHGPNYSPVALFDSSSYFLTHVNKFDGVIDLPRPSRGLAYLTAYLTTYPFTNKDVKKWAWLFSVNIEEKFLEENKRGRLDRDAGLPDGEILGPTVRRARNESPWYDPGTVDIPSVYLSRALDTEVIPEDTAGVSYLIVTQNRYRPAGAKLLVAESRKAAGITVFYETLKGDSTVFMGAVVGFGGKVHQKRFRRVENLEEARRVEEEGAVGVIC